MSGHTPTPWTLRPRHFDDWGVIRGADGGLACIARGHSDKEFDQHRIDKTDPYEANAAFIVKAVNNHEALVKALIKIASMDLKGIRADDLGRAARIAAEAISDCVGQTPGSR